MLTAPSQLEYLLTTPSETLNVELKCWIDPQEPAAAAAKIVKGCLALRNRNGGYLVAGVDDKSRRPEPHPGGWDAAERFHVDRIQDLISRHASERFEVEVVFVASAAGSHPVIVVPSGVRAPVALKQALADPAGKPLLKVGEVPFRTLNANGRVSTAAARTEDWQELVGICFDNREADFAGFLRRHLAAMTPDLLRTLSAGLAAAPPARDLGTRAMDWLETGRERFALVSAEVDVRVKAEWGGWEAGLVIDPPLPDPTPDQAFLNRIYAANPSYSGWPIWRDLRGIGNICGLSAGAGGLAKLDISD